MYAPVNSLFPLGVLVSVLLWAPSAALGAGETMGSGQEGADRFVPSFSFSTGIRVNEWGGDGESRICRDCSLSDPGATPEAPDRELDPAFDGNDLDVTPFVSGTLEVMSPELPIPGSPRFFIGGEFGGAFGTERKVAREGNPGEIGSPLPPEGRTQFVEKDASGQGSEVVMTYGDFVFGAQAGLALPFEWLGRQFRLRPSVGWTQFEVDVQGLVVDVECQPGAGQCNEANDNGGFLREVRLTSTTTERFNGIGPGLELEMETGRMGPFTTTILVGAQAYKILGDTQFALAVPPTTFGPDPATQANSTDEYDANFRFQVDPWIYRMTIGVRFHWVGQSR